MALHAVYQELFYIELKNVQCPFSLKNTHCMPKSTDTIYCSHNYLKVQSVIVNAVHKMILIHC